MKKIFFVSAIILSAHYSCSDNHIVSSYDNKDIKEKLIGIWEEQAYSYVGDPTGLVNRSTYLLRKDNTFIDSIYAYNGQGRILRSVTSGNYNVEENQLLFSNFEFTYIDTSYYGRRQITYLYTKVTIENDSTMHLFRFQKLFSEDNANEFWGHWYRSIWSAVYHADGEPRFSSLQG